MDDITQARINKSLREQADLMATEVFTPDFRFEGGDTTNGRLYHHGQLFTGRFDGWSWKDGQIVDGEP